MVTNPPGSASITDMRDILYKTWLSIRRWWQRRRSVRMFWICATITNCATGSKDYKYYCMWAKTKSDAIANLEKELKRSYTDPNISIRCRTGYSKG
jgi:hypothetical protein